MRTAVPVMTDDVASLKPRLPRAQHGRTQPRLHMLDLRASGQAQTRRDVAQLLGGHRHTLGRWLTLYEAGGLGALRARDVPAGNPLSLPPDVLAAIEPALQQPAGFAAYEALRPWGQQTSPREGNSHTLSTMIRTTVKARLKVPRPRHTKQP